MATTIQETANGHHIPTAKDPMATETINSNGILNYIARLDHDARERVIEALLLAMPRDEAWRIIDGANERMNCCTNSTSLHTPGGFSQICNCECHG